MPATINKNKKIKARPKGAVIFKQMLDDKKTISKHLQSGGTFKELRKKGYRFATV
ncbi:MAG: hypothetical protein M3Z56_11985 [Bacteroidota bacterium]|nr:hypothetical protein [Bacteroidota bacterium]